MVHLFLVMLFACGSVCQALDGGREAAETAWQMRWRTACDPVAGWACRYPYTWRMPDQYKTEFVRGQEPGDKVETREVVIQGKKMMVRVDSGGGKGPVLRVFSAEQAGELDAIGDKEAGAKLTWKDFNYYGDRDQRPHGDPAWAVEGITARLGSSAKDPLSVLVVRHGARVSGIVVRLPYDDERLDRLIASFEILSTGVKSAKPSKDARVMTWREQQVRKKSVVFDSDGKPIPVAKKLPSPAWKGAWEIETEHYHITGHLTQARLAWHGLYAEALYKAYHGLFEPEQMPAIKFEVHIFNTYREFQQAAAAWGNGFNAGPGGIVGGFFVPDLLSLWVYEESGKLGGDDFSTEHVMAHECSHQFLHLACNGSDHVPTWINEGIAVYFEAGKFSNGVFQLHPPTERIDLLKRQYEELKSTLWPLDRYIGHAGGISASMYGEVYAMTHFWVFGAGKEGKKRFHEYWNRLKKKEDGQKAFESVFMEDMIKAKGSREAAVAAWQQALLTYVKSLK